MGEALYPEASAILSQIKEQVTREPTDAYVAYFYPDLPDPFIIQNEIYGSTLDTDALKQQVLAMAGGQFMRYDGKAVVVKDEGLLAQVREKSPQIMEMYDQNGWEMGIFYLENGHAEIRSIMDVKDEFAV